MGNTTSVSLGRKMTNTEALFYNSLKAFTKSVLWLHVGANGQVNADDLAVDLMSSYEVDYRQTEYVKLTREVASYWATEWNEGRRADASVAMLRKYHPEIVLS